MTKLSVWAKYHPLRARTLIVLMHILLFLLAVNTGIGLMDLGLSPAAVSIYIPVFLFFTAAFLYPCRKRQNTRFNKWQLYAIRKSCDFLLSACFFVLVCFITNNYSNAGFNGLSGTAEATAISSSGEKPTATAILASLAYRDKSTLTRVEKRILKNECRKQLRIYTMAKLTKDDEAGEKALFIILSIIAAIGLSFLLAGLACSIACNGSAAGAIIVGLVGLTAIIWLLILAINKIKQHQKTPVEEKAG